MAEEKVTFDELAWQVVDSDGVWVRLYDGLKLCLTDILLSDDVRFIAKFMPCARNAREYVIRFEEVKALVKDNTCT